MKKNDTKNLSKFLDERKEQRESKIQELNASIKNAEEIIKEHDAKKDLFLMAVDMDGYRENEIQTRFFRDLVDQQRQMIADLKKGLTYEECVSLWNEYIKTAEPELEKLKAEYLRLKNEMCDAFLKMQFYRWNNIIDIRNRLIGESDDAAKKKFGYSGDGLETPEAADSFAWMRPLFNDEFQARGVNVLNPFNA